MRKTIFIISLCLIAAFLIYISIPQNQNLKITLIKESIHALDYDEEGAKINVNLFFNTKSSIYTNPEKINSVYLSSDYDSYLINLETITYVTEVKIANEKFYQYDFAFNFTMSEEIYFAQAYLNLQAHQSSVKLNLGSFSYFKITSSDNNIFRLQNLKALVNGEDQKCINAIIIGLNPIGEEFFIEEFEVLDYNITSEEAIFLNHHNYNTSDDINSLIDYKYNRFSSYKSWETTKITKENILLIPLIYKENYSPNILAFRLKIRVKDKIYNININSFCFFIENNKLININDLIIYEYDFV